MLRKHITERSFEHGVRYPERAVDDVVRAWCVDGEADHVTLRRHRADDLLLTREHGVYWRAWRSSPAGPG